jgi:hypothetical protein
VPEVAAADLGPVPRGRLAVGPQSHQPARRALRQLSQEDRGAGKAALLAAALADGPGEPRLDRAGGAVDLVAVERQARLQPQRIPRSQPGRADLVPGEQGLR